jgi:hypothetical protein
MLRIGTIVLGVADVRRATDFWTQALHYVPRGPGPGHIPVLSPVIDMRPVHFGLGDTACQNGGSRGIGSHDNPR